MNPITRRYIKRYTNLWKQGESYSKIISRTGIHARFYARQHRFTQPEALGKSWFSEHTIEKYDSAIECLACYRWFIIPEHLRQASGRYDLKNIDELLDLAGYSKSLIAEELFFMIDSCLESGICLKSDLEMIRRAYNGLSGFEDLFINRITDWGLDGSDRGKISDQPESEINQKGFYGKRKFLMPVVSVLQELTGLL
ncbi:MAG: hypothetical protein KAQ97_06085 [Candidatus Fermentibacteraceae bacterium]|nr:hypothetical protein [Candidatus Fermentibacteraceae bacterium]